MNKSTRHNGSSTRPPSVTATPKLTEAEFNAAVKKKREYATLHRLREAVAEAERMRQLNKGLCDRVDTLGAELEHLLFDQRIAVIMFTGLGMVAGFLAGLLYAGL